MTLISKVGGAERPALRHPVPAVRLGGARRSALTPQGWAACLDAGRGRRADRGARRSRATRPWWTRSCPPPRPCGARSTGARPSPTRSARAADAAEEGAQRHDPARRPQGPGELSRRAERGAPGPGRHLERPPGALRGARVERLTAIRSEALTWRTYAGAIDQGTTSTRFMIFDHGGHVVSIAQKEHEQIYPEARLGRARPGRGLERAPRRSWARRSSRPASPRTSSRRSGSPTSARRRWCGTETTGKAVYNAIVWQDTRTDQICNELMADGGQDRFRPKTGLPIATYFSGPKVRWILDNVEGAAARAESGDLLFGNMDTWVIWNLTGGTNGGLHITDVTNASRTMLMDLATSDWDEELLRRDRRAARDAPRDQGVQRGVRRGDARVGRRASRWPATSATSRPRSSARPASPSARRRTPTAPATSCCSTPAPTPVPSKNGLITTAGYRIGDAADRLRARGLDRHHRARSSSGCATTSS